MQIVAVCDQDPAKLEAHKDKGYALFTDSDELISSGLCDACVWTFLLCSVPSSPLHAAHRQLSQPPACAGS